MFIKRTSIVGLVALALAAPAMSQDFRERMAQYQRPAQPAPRAKAAYPARPAMIEEVEEAPAATSAAQPQAAPRNGPRTLSNVYEPPVHTPDYNAAMAPACATCGHHPGFLAPGDFYGTCDYAGGACGPGGFGCGPCGGLFGVEGNCKSCGGCFGGCGPCDDGCCPPWYGNSLVWAKFELLLWWRQGRDLPPLVTTDPPTENPATAGVLPDAQILFGGGRDGTTMQAGGRFDAGVWCDTAQCIGIGNRFFGLGKDSSEFHAFSNNVPVLAVPFQDFTNNNVNDALLIAYPGLRTGEIHVASTGSVLGNDVYAKFLLCRDYCQRWDFITGWNYSRVADQIRLDTRSTVVEVGGVIPTGTVRTTFDQWAARNDFHGAIFGLQWQRYCGCWTAQVLARMSIGNMHETMTISGSTVTAVPNQAPNTTTGGALTAASNIGTVERNEFTAITEAGVNLAYRFAPCTQFTFGYTFIYFHDIVSPGSAIDTSIGTSGGVTHPQFAFRHSDFWAQGLSLGLVQEF